MEVVRGQKGHRERKLGGNSLPFTREFRPPVAEVGVRVSLGSNSAQLGASAAAGPSTNTEKGGV